MDIKEIIKEVDLLARNNEPMPNCLAAYEQAYYISSRGLYQQYESGKITLDQARNEKIEVVKQYENGKKSWDYFMELHLLSTKLEELKDQGFNSILEWEILASLDKMLHET